MLKVRTLALDDHYNTQQSLVFGHCDLDLTQHAAHVPTEQGLRGERVLCGPHRGSDSAEVFARAARIPFSATRFRSGMVITLEIKILPD